jgi:beta-glucanase (GH16 family)
MKRPLLIMLGLFASSSAHAQIPPGYVMTFDDEFSGTTLDLTKWSTGWAWANGSGLNTSTYPNDEGLPGNIVVTGGVANFSVTKGPTPHRQKYGTAVMTTNGKFSQKYGYFEASIKLPPNANGIWPAFWMVPGSFAWPPEIDIMEWHGSTPKINYMTLWWGTSSNPLYSDGTYTAPAPLSDGYHAYGMLWTPTAVTWYIDGVQRYTVTSNIPTVSMYIILNADTGYAAMGPFATLPSVMSVAYVRAYAPPS